MNKGDEGALTAISMVVAAMFLALDRLEGGSEVSDVVKAAVRSGVRALERNGEHSEEFMEGIRETLERLGIDLSASG